MTDKNENFMTNADIMRYMDCGYSKAKEIWNICRKMSEERGEWQKDSRSVRRKDVIKLTK